MALRFGELRGSFLLLCSEFPSAWRRKCSSDLHRQSAPAPGSPAPCFYPGENSLGVRGQIQERSYFLTGLIPFVPSKWSLHAKQDFISCSLGSKAQSLLISGIWFISSYGKREGILYSEECYTEGIQGHFKSVSERQRSCKHWV